jgi:hypothetical protein
MHASKDLMWQVLYKKFWIFWKLNRAVVGPDEVEKEPVVGALNCKLDSFPMKYSLRPY